MAKTSAAGKTALDKPRKVVLAYSGGLDTSVILKWLQDTYGCEVVTFTADLGQGEELTPARKKAEMLGVKQIFIEDLREEFVRDFVFPMFRCNTVYEGEYLLGTSIARPLIAKRQIEIARQAEAERERDEYRDYTKALSERVNLFEAARPEIERIVNERARLDAENRSAMERLTRSTAWSSRPLPRSKCFDSPRTSRRGGVTGRSQRS